MILIIVFIYGLVIGSFLNVCIYRLPAGESIVSPPSHCSSCNKRLTALELIPVLSYLLQGGKCRSCRIRISPRYPLIELAVGLLFLFTFSLLGSNLNAVFVALLASLLLAIAIIDTEHYIIPNSLNLAIFILGILYNLFSAEISFLNGILSTLAVAGFFLFLGGVLFKGKLGGGDVKLSAALAMWLGFPDIALMVFLASLSGLIFTLIGLVLKRREKSDPVPFGPFLALGALITIFWGQMIWAWYFGIIFG